jgi:hypothetical protein
LNFIRNADSKLVKRLISIIRYHQENENTTNEARIYNKDSNNKTAYIMKKKKNTWEYLFVRSVHFFQCFYATSHVTLKCRVNMSRRIPKTRLVCLSFETRFDSF